MAKDLILDRILACLAQIWASQIFFASFISTNIVPSYHPIKFQGKLMDQTWENGKKPNFGFDFGPFSPKFAPPKFFCWS